MPSVFGLPPDAFCLHLAAESSAAIASNVLLRTPVSRRNASPFSSLTESNLIAAPLWRQRIKPWLIEGYARGLFFAKEATTSTVLGRLGKDRYEERARLDPLINLIIPDTGKLELVVHPRLDPGSL